MAYSKCSLIQTSFIEVLSSLQVCCAENGCEGEVCFKFLQCGHSACGGCLFKSLHENSTANSDILCPGCLHKSTREYRTVYYVTYRDFLKKQTEFNFCTSCFCQKAIYRAPCRHLLCEPCLTSLCNLKPQPCNVQGCDFIYSSDVVKKALENASDMEIWQTFRLTRGTKCQGICCDSRAVVDIVGCGHALCLSCISKSQKMRTKGRKQDNKVYQLCNSAGCSSKYSILSAQRLIGKKDDISFMSASNLEIRIDYCQICGKRKKETIRIRTCHYLHTKCIHCILSEIKKSSNKKDSSATNVENRQIICKFYGCENGAPYQCFDAVICILSETKLMVTLKLFILCVNMQCLHNMLFTSFTY